MCTRGVPMPKRIISLSLSLSWASEPKPLGERSIPKTSSGVDGSSAQTNWKIQSGTRAAETSVRCTQWMGACESHTRNKNASPSTKSHPAARQRFDETQNKTFPLAHSHEKLKEPASQPSSTSPKTSRQGCLHQNERVVPRA